MAQMEDYGSPRAQMAQIVRPSIGQPAFSWEQPDGVGLSSVASVSICGCIFSRTEIA